MIGIIFKKNVDAGYFFLKNMHTIYNLINDNNFTLLYLGDSYSPFIDGRLLILSKYNLTVTLDFGLDSLMIDVSDSNSTLAITFIDYDDPNFMKKLTRILTAKNGNDLVMYTYYANSI
ncbi:MAG: hypothetical protein ACP5IZ_10840 [Thermoprotei archaeon]|jgi:hypothetical protein